MASTISRWSSSKSERRQRRSVARFWNGAPIEDRVVLESPNPVPVDIEVGATTPITFVFGIGDTAIAFGNGQLAVDIDVNDRRGAGGASGAGGNGGAGGTPECTSDPDCEDGDL